MQATTQVQVSEEPYHRPVLQNKYVRLLDVWLPPGDTTMYHIHKTPSLFVYLTTTDNATQMKGEGWVKNRSAAGYAWFRSFTPDTLVHRVANVDSDTFHVNDIEILSPYDTTNRPKKPLELPVLFENEVSYAYQLTNSNIDGKAIQSRGPLIAELITGDKVIFTNTTTTQSKEIRTGQYLYIEPRTSFHLSAGTGNIKMIVFEIK
jgi:hypothetical protein